MGKHWHNYAATALGRECHWLLYLCTFPHVQGRVSCPCAIMPFVYIKVFRWGLVTDDWNPQCGGKALLPVCCSLSLARSTLFKIVAEAFHQDVIETLI